MVAGPLGDLEVAFEQVMLALCHFWRAVESRLSHGVRTLQRERTNARRRLVTNIGRRVFLSTVHLFCARERAADSHVEKVDDQHETEK